MTQGVKEKKKKLLISDQDSLTLTSDLVATWTIFLILAELDNL